MAEDDKVALRAIYRGTQTGQMGPFPPSGRKVAIPFRGILRIQNGKIAEMWVEWDNVAVLTQLGHMPRTAGGVPVVRKGPYSRPGSSAES